MRIVIVMALAAIAMVFADPAEARRRGSSTQDMLFVSDTEVIVEGEAYALCHLVETNSVFFVNLFRSLEGYVLAPNKCEAERYLPLGADDLASAKAAGAIPASVPDTPKLSTGAMLGGHWGWLLILAVVGFAGLGYLKSARRRKERQAMMDGASPAATAILDAMCHAAKADGTIAPEEIAEIQSVAEKMTGQSFDAALVRKMADLAEEDPSDGDFKRFAKGRTPDEKDLIMKGVLMVVASDGQLDGKEQEFVGKLGKALAMSGDQINALLGEVLQAKS